MNINSPIEILSLKACFFEVKNILLAELDALNVDVEREAPHPALLAVEVEILNVDVSNAAVNIWLDYSIRVRQIMLRIYLSQEADGVKLNVGADTEEELLCFGVVSSCDLKIDFVSVEVLR